MNPVRGIETSQSKNDKLLIHIFQINESRSRDWNDILQNLIDRPNDTFKLMNPVRGIETSFSNIIQEVYMQFFQINESRSRDWNVRQIGGERVNIKLSN